MAIYVFKTSVKKGKQIRVLATLLDEICTPGKWNFDLDDCDKILRIDSQNEILNAVTALLQTNGFQCEELGEFQLENHHLSHDGHFCRSADKHGAQSKT
jgi:hypothetical protein